VPNTDVFSGGQLAINISGRIRYMTNIDPVADLPSFEAYTGATCGATAYIDVYSGGTLQLGEPADGNSKSGTLHVTIGSTVRIRSGGVLRVSDYSTLLIEPGATLILDPGAQVLLDAPDARIRIEGDLVVNGDIQFSGLGYFDFGLGNRLVFGPGYQAFRLQGAGKPQRFVRLSAPLEVAQGHRLHWAQGLVEVAGGACALSGGAGLQFEDVTLLGAGAPTAIEAYESGPVGLLRCKVQGLDLAIIGDGWNGCKLESCEFLQYAGTVGTVYWRNAFALTLFDCYFYGSADSRALRTEGTAFVLLDGSYFSGHQMAQPGLLTESDLASPSTASAIWAEGAVAYLVAGSHFNNNTVGIQAPSYAAPANVYAYEGASFTNNYAAIYLNGDATRGAVLADCALFQDNREGIRGNDVTLMLDS
jgi:hypothetical protein